MMKNLLLIAFIAVTCWSCSQNSSENKKEKIELVLEQKDLNQKVINSKHALENALNNLESLNDDQEKYLKSKSGDEQVIFEEAEKFEEENLKRNLDELQRLNNDQMNLP